MNRTIIFGVVLLFLGISLIIFLGGFGGDVTGSAILDDKETLEELDGVVSLEVVGKGLSFYIKGEENPDVRVKKGDLVKINFKSAAGFHDFVIDEFGVATEKLSEGEKEVSLEFVASEKGVFEYYCSVGQHRIKGMRGNFIVE